MGLIVNIFRDGYDSELNAFHGLRAVTVTNLPGPFEPTPDRPAAELSRNSLGDPIIVPVEDPKGLLGPMFGGAYGATSDSRFRPGFYGAVPIHDRYEDLATYNTLST